jgi:hypothetical protein
MKSAIFRCVAVLAALVAADPSGAADVSYMGTWTISAAVPAPWADSNQKHDGAEQSRLMGKSIVFKAKEITGPAPFACKTPHYKQSDFASDMLFQGAFDEMRAKDKSVDPDKLAATLGFAGKSIRTLETGCEFDFHFVDAATAEVGLNGAVYTLSKR